MVKLWIQREALRGLLIAEYGFEMKEIIEVENAALSDVEMIKVAELATQPATNTREKFPAVRDCSQRDRSAI